jgi:hypothetical protein
MFKKVTNYWRNQLLLLFLEDDKMATEAVDIKLCFKVTNMTRFLDHLVAPHSDLCSFCIVVLLFILSNICP